MNTTIKPRNRILSLGLALCLLLGMTLYLPGPVEVRAANVELGTAADLTPDPDATGMIPGNQVYFGKYDNQPIRWRVLENDNGEALLFSESILHTMPFKEFINVWAESSARAYLNTELLEKLPDVLQAQGVIVETDTTIGSHTTNDKLYLLSVDEVHDYSLTQNELSASADWWLRSPGSDAYYAAAVSSDGTVLFYGIGVNNGSGIRPALRLNLSSAIFTSAGDGTDGSPWVVGGIGDTLQTQTLSEDTYVQIRIENEDTLWKVIKIDGGQATLLCTKILESMAYNDRGNIWALSDARALLNPATEWDYEPDTFSFAGGEREAINTVQVIERDMKTNDALFLLSQEEATNPKYFLDNDARKSGDYWWLRSPGLGAISAAVVSSGGGVTSFGDGVGTSYGIRPAFRLNLSSVLFTSAAVGGKSVAAGDPLFSAAKPQGGAVKLTVKDDVNLGLNITGPDTINAPAGSLVTIPYTGAQTGLRRSVSVVIADSGSGEPLFYGRPVDCSNGNASGTAKFQLPPVADLSQGSYKLLVFNEEVNGDKQTDYASTPRELTLTVGAPDTAKPTVTAVAPDGDSVSIGTSSLSVAFDKEMDIDVVGTVSINPGATVTNPQWQLGSRAITYDLSDLDYATTYTVSISGFKDTSQNEMEAVTDNRYQFTTESAVATPTDLKVGSMKNDSVAEGEDYRKTIPVDYNGSLPLGYSASGLPDGLQINGNTISGQPDTGTSSGSPYTITVEVKEQGGTLADTRNYTLEVTTTATATQLTLAPPTDLTVTEGEDFTKTFSVTYTGTDPLKYTISGLPDGVDYSTTTGEVTGPANLGTARDIPYSITVEVTDSNGNDDNGSFDLTVLPASSPPPQSSHTITASAGIGGSISPSGNVSVADGDDQIFTITPNENYKISDVLVDDVSEGDVATYTFQNVTGDHTIHATFESIGGGSVNPDPDPTPAPSGSTRRGSSSGSGGSDLPIPVKTRLPASAFTWEGRTLTIDHDSITTLGLLSVQWDGKALTRGTDYGVYQGSVIVRFSEDFMAAQAPGDHTVKVEFLNHTGETTVTVGETGLSADEPNDDLFDNNTYNPNTGGYPDGSTPGTDNPNTGDGRAIWFALLLGSIGAAALIELRPRLEVK